MYAMTRSQHVLASTTLAWCVTAGAATAQGVAPYAGGIAGISTLSADAASIISSDAAAVSVYKPENGPALNLLFGVHLHRYVTVQANYIWNRNDVTLIAAQVVDDRASFYEQRRNSAQHALVGDLLVYFRERPSRVRPYLSGGVGVVRLRSQVDGSALVRRSSALPPPVFEATRATFRVAVGMDVVLGGAWRFRYSFSESLSGNPISLQLSPPAPRGLANFQNLWGVLREF